MKRSPIDSGFGRAARALARKIGATRSRLADNGVHGESHFGVGGRISATAPTVPALPVWRRGNRTMTATSHEPGERDARTCGLAIDTRDRGGNR